MKLLKEKASLTGYSLALAVYTLVAFHQPFFSHMLPHLEGGFNGVVIVATAALLLLGLAGCFAPIDYDLPEDPI